MATAKAVKEQVNGLQQSPVDGGKFVVRKIETPVEANPDTGVQAYTHDLVLVVPDEGEYKVALYGYDDNALINGTYQVIQVRKSELREKLFNDNAEVELTA